MDDEWKYSPEGDHAPDGYGSLNNVLEIKPISGIEDAFEGASASATGGTAAAPARRSEAGARGLMAGRSLRTGRASPPGEYGQQIPDVKSMRAKAPPTLPPHLLPGILNADISEIDPIQLPVPNHVMLNHLYALSIRDGVLVLGATHRYREKYVTTVLFRPVDA